MLDRLPTDILDRVLEIACPPLTWPSYGYRVCGERHQALLALSLVNKAIGRRSQKLLWEEIDYSGDMQSYPLHRLCERGEAKELAKTVKTVHAHGESYPSAVVDSIQLFHSLENICLSSLAEPIDVRYFKECRGLRTLSLQGTNLDYASSVRNIFPNLVELNMESACMPLSTANVFFRAENFPSLRVFGLHNSAAFEETYGSWQRKYFAYPLSPTFLDRFELFQYTPPISDVSGSLPPWSRAPTLFTIRRSFETFFANFLTMSPSYLRLVLMPDEIQYDFTFPDFADLSAVISKAKNLRILFLPAFISPASENELKPDAKEKIKGLLDVCKERDVEIIWHDEDDESGWAISPAFRRYAGRLRAEQAEGVRDGA